MYKFLRIFCGGILQLLFKLKVYDKNKIPENGPVIICANHTSAMDPIVLAQVCDRKIYFMAKEELFNKPVLGFFVRKLDAFPVNRSKTDLKSVRTAMSILKRGDVLGIFPEGTRVKTVSADNIKEGVGMISNRTGAPILPVYIDTEYKFFRPIKVSFRDLVYPENFKDFGRDANKEITMEVYKKIYNIEE